MVDIEKKIAGAKKFLIRHVNPKFIHYDKPFFLAVIVALCTYTVVAVLTFFLVTMDCKTKLVSNFDAGDGQINFLAHARGGGLKMCLHEPELYTTFTSASGLEVLRTQPCMPPEWFVKGKWASNYVDGIIHPKKFLKFAEEGLEWCEDVPFKTKEECAKKNGGPCADCEQPAPGGKQPAVGGQVYRMTFAQTECPTNVQAIGIALGYANHLEVFLTLVLVFLFMLCRVLHQLGPNGKESLCQAAKGQLEADIDKAIDKDAKVAATDAVNAA